MGTPPFFFDSSIAHSNKKCNLFEKYIAKIIFFSKNGKKVFGKSENVLTFKA